MILPTKHINVLDSILGIGALLLAELERPRTVSSLWDRVRNDPHIVTFERFMLGLDLLFILGAIDLREDKLWRAKS